jgi:hypothetical protein
MEGSRAMSQVKPLSELATVVRSKNAGPHRLTLDVLFTSPEVFDAVLATGALNTEAVARTYGVPATAVSSAVVFRPGLAFKFTLRRPWVQGALGESDHYGAQQHAPLLDLEIPWPPTEIDRTESASAEAAARK